MRTAMRHSVPILATLSLAACIGESQQARPMEPGPAAAPDRSQQTLREIDLQQRWTAEALAGRPAADELEAARDGDAGAISDTRRRFRRLVIAVDRTTWIRETVPAILRGSADPDRFVAAKAGPGTGRDPARGHGSEAAAGGRSGRWKGRAAGRHRRAGRRADHSGTRCGNAGRGGGGGRRSPCRPG